MTVKELIDISPFCDCVEVVIRNNGKWVQGYTVGKNAKLYPVNLSTKIREKYHLERYKNKTISLDEGDEVDCEHGRGLPMKVICKDVSKIPEYIGNLKINHVQPRNIPIIHGDSLTHNDFYYDIVCFPNDFIPEIEEKTDKNEQIEGQMRIEDFI